MKNNFQIDTKIGTQGTLVDQVYHYLEELIDEGLLEFGQQLPPEHDLAEQLGVSRFSLREALQRLLANGYIITRRGIGTFVNKPIGHKYLFGFEKLHSLSGSLISEGYRPGIKEIYISTEMPSKDIQNHLKIDENEEIIKIERLRTRDSKLFNWSTDFLKESIANHSIAKSNLGFSLYKFLEVNCGVFISYAKAKIKPYQADAIIREKLEIPEGSFVIKIEQIHYLENGEPVMFSEEYFPEQDCSINIVRKR